jgi:hypothetical protein
MALTQVAGGLIASGQTITSPTITGGTWTSPSGSTVTSGTVVATTSGTTVDFTSIPSWVKRITVMLNAVGVSGATGTKLLLGTSGSLETSGYTWQTSTNGVSATGNTSYFQPGLRNTTTYRATGVLTLNLINATTNTWMMSMLTATTVDNSDVWMAAGSKALSGTLTRLQLGTIDGTSTFTTGSINILYE